MECAGFYEPLGGHPPNKEARMERAQTRGERKHQDSRQRKRPTLQPIEDSTD